MLKCVDLINWFHLKPAALYLHCFEASYSHTALIMWDMVCPLLRGKGKHCCYLVQVLLASVLMSLYNNGQSDSC